MSPFTSCPVLQGDVWSPSFWEHFRQNVPFLNRSKCSCSRWRHAAGILASDWPVFHLCRSKDHCTVCSSGSQLFLHEPEPSLSPQEPFSSGQRPPPVEPHLWEHRGAQTKTKTRDQRPETRLLPVIFFSPSWVLWCVTASFGFTKLGRKQIREQLVF